MISVIIPVYNRAQYIGGCLDSVLNQTYKDYEIIVVDDGSTDNLREVLTPYMERIKYIYKENGGAASARNEGMKYAKGEYIAWLDSDDMWLPFKLELQVGILDKLSYVGFIYSDFCCFSNDKSEISGSYIREYFHILNQYNLTFENMYKNKMLLKDFSIRFHSVDENTIIYSGDISDKVLLGPMFPTPTTITRRKCIDDLGGFNEKYKTSEDVDFHMRIAKKYQVAFVNTITTRCRRFHPDQLSSSKMEIESNLSWLDITESLGKNDKEYYRKHKRLIDLRISHCYYGIGYAYYKKHKLKEAIYNFLKSLKINWKQKKIYMYTLFSLLKIPVDSLRNVLLKPKAENG